ncbi:hypothetical protein UFOVP1106_18 [uncultured Caudovirales phage]|uniref:Uncharacterized protein n=1 Tax=uncultured Caudovirales phage TaxID=2100421 RepID=A0A6J5QRI0_9CAUD|nr:hypothetical protein UFOVP1106_18 [uncultured Caudovirales phage]
MPAINTHALIDAIKQGQPYATITEQLNVSKRTIIRYAKKIGEARRAPNGEPNWQEARKFKGERLTNHYYFSKQNANDSFILNCF